MQVTQPWEEQLITFTGPTPTQEEYAIHEKIKIAAKSCGKDHTENLTVLFEEKITKSSPKIMNKP